jgi:hypothetical protein
LTGDISELLPVQGFDVAEAVVNNCKQQKTCKMEFSGDGEDDNDGEEGCKVAEGWDDLLIDSNNEDDHGSA